MIAKQGFTKEVNAFLSRWCGKDFFGNPVFTEAFITKTLQKALRDYKRDPHHTRIVLIVPNWTNAPWFHLTRRFHTLASFPSGTPLFSARPRFPDNRWTPAGVEGTPGRYVAQGCPFPILVLGLGRFQKER